MRLGQLSPFGNNGSDEEFFSRRRWHVLEPITLSVTWMSIAVMRFTVPRQCSRQID